MDFGCLANSKTDIGFEMTLRKPAVFRVLRPYVFNNFFFFSKFHKLGNIIRNVHYLRQPECFLPVKIMSNIMICILFFP